MTCVPSAKKTKKKKRTTTMTKKEGESKESSRQPTVPVRPKETKTQAGKPSFVRPHLLSEFFPDVPCLPVQVVKGLHPRLRVVAREVHVDLCDLKVRAHADLGNLSQHHVLLVVSVLPVGRKSVQDGLVETQQVCHLPRELLLQPLHATLVRLARHPSPRDEPPLRRRL